MGAAYWAVGTRSFDQTGKFTLTGRSMRSLSLVWSVPSRAGSIAAVVRLPSPPRSETGWVTRATGTGYGPPHDSGDRPCAAGNRPRKRSRTR